MPELCLRCYISNSIKLVCFDLETEFGKDNGFSSKDLLPFVLYDEVLSQSYAKTSYKSLATSIIQTFDPNKGSLKTWVKRYVKQHPEIQIILLQHGVFFISDWALLNDTNPKQLQRIFIQTYQSASVEIQQSSELLISYHAVYREDRLQERLKGKSLPCQPPTSKQLTRIINDLEARTNRILSKEMASKQLKLIAEKLRKYRIGAKVGFIPTVSINQPEIEPIVDSLLTHQIDTEMEELEFLKLYNKEFMSSLDLAISEVIEDFVSRLQRKSKSKSKTINNLKQQGLKKEGFIKGLHLFHCQGKSMGQIAPEIGLKKQYEVTRLLKLKELRADIRHKILNILSQRVMEISKYFVDSDRLQSLDKQLELILDERITDIIEEAESEVKNPQRNQPLRNLIARRICCYLDKKI